MDGGRRRIFSLGYRATVNTYRSYVVDVSTQRDRGLKSATTLRYNKIAKRCEDKVKIEDARLESSSYFLDAIKYSFSMTHFKGW